MNRKGLKKNKSVSQVARKPEGADDNSSERRQSGITLHKELCKTYFHKNQAIKSSKRKKNK